MTFFDSGVVVRVSAAFVNSAGSATDPAVVKFSYIAAALAVTTTLTYGTDVALVKASTGNYYVDIDSRESAGLYDHRFFSTGVGQTSSQAQFYIRPATV